MDAKKSAGGVGTLVGLSASVYLSSHLSWASDHPHWAMGLYIATGIFALFTVLQFSWVQRLFGLQPIENQRPAETKIEAQDKSIAVGRDAVGSILDSSSGHSFIGDSAISAALGRHTVVPPSKSDPPVILQFLKSRSGPSVLKFENRRWVWTPNTLNAHRAIVLYVENPLPSPGEPRNPCAREIAARLKFTGDVAGHVAVSERAYWVDEVINNVDIKPGTSKAILLGTFSSGIWRVFSNKVEGVPARHSRHSTIQSMRSGAYWSDEQPNFVDMVACQQFFTLEVSLFMVDGTPIIRETFEVKRIENEETSTFLLLDGK
jgi:hypothetical protein